MRPILLCLLMWSGSAFPLTFPEENLRIDSMMHRADAVIHAEVADRTVARNPDDGVPHTFYQMTVHDVIAGRVRPGDLLVVRVFGGQVNEETWGFYGTPIFEIGDNIVVFLRNNGDAEVPFVNSYAGAYWANIGPNGHSFITNADGFPIKAVGEEGIDVDRDSNNAQCIQAALLPEVRDNREREMRTSRGSLLTCPSPAEQFTDTVGLKQFIAALNQRPANPTPREMRSIPFGEFDERSRQALAQASRPVSPPSNVPKSR